MSYFSEAELQAMLSAGVTPPVVTETMLAYSHTRYLLIAVSFLYSTITLLLILYTGTAARLRDLIVRSIRPKLLHVPVFYLSLATLIMFIRLPLSYFAGYYLDHSYSLSQQGLADWFADLLKSNIVYWGLMAVALTLVFGAIEKWKRAWPYVLWAVLTPLIAFGIFLAPLLVDPLFNSFTPMPEGSLKARIERVAARAGIANAPIFIVDKSRQTKKINAYVTGLGSSARIVIWDNTIKRLPPDEIESIVAHEAGHYVLGHIMLGFLCVAAGLLALLVSIARYGERLVARLPARWNIRTLTDPAIIAVVLLVATAGSFILAPVENTISRTMEQQADAFALKTTANGAALARTFVSLGKENLAEPAPPDFIQFWFFSHPSLRDRILFALGRKSW